MDNKERIEIENRIWELNKERFRIKSSIEQYRNMCSKISQAVSQLSNASRGLGTAQSQLKKNYTSKTSLQKVGDIQSAKGKVDQLVQLLNGTILSEANKKIRELTPILASIESQINSLTASLSN